MEIVLVRHGEPEWVRNGLSVGDPPLTERGVEQAKITARHLEGEHFDEILVSPLQRARQTAAPLLKLLDRPEVIAPWLHEIRDPGWDGGPAEKAERAYAEMRRMAPNDRWHGLEGGESVRDFVDRIHNGAEYFLAERSVSREDHELPVWTITDPGRRILLFAHAGTNSVTIGHLLGLVPTPWEWDRFVIGHCSITRICSIEIGGAHTFSLRRLAGDEHLPVDIRTR